MQHQELWRAVGTHYWPTRIYGPTGHAIGGTAQQALLELLLVSEEFLSNWTNSYSEEESMKIAFGQLQS
jgi:hypothetical protein